MEGLDKRPLLGSGQLSPAPSSFGAGSGSDGSDVLLACARILFINGETTQKVVETTAALGAAMGLQATLFPGWGELGLQIAGREGQHHVVPAIPAGVDMRRVASAAELVDHVRAGRMSAAEARAALASVERMKPIPVSSFAGAAGAGAAALGVIFGAGHLVSLALIAASAAASAVLRRWLAKRTANLFVQPFCAALLAGAFGAAAVRVHLSSTSWLVALCPCMILVPGTHILNAALDTARGRLPLAAARLFFSTLVIAAVCTGLLAGFAAMGVHLPETGMLTRAPLALDVMAAGVAVAASGTFFSMPWRTLPVPAVIGMAAHACWWAVVMRLGASAAVGAFAASTLVGVVATPAAQRLRVPFAALGFACVVPLLPGVYLFRMASGMVELATSTVPHHPVLLATAIDGATALLVVLAIAAGLVVPRLCIAHFLPAGAFAERLEPSPATAQGRG